MAASLGKMPIDAGAAFDLCAAKRASRCDVEPLEQVGAPQLAPVAGREVAKGQHVFPGLGHELSRPGELAGQHGGHLIPLLLKGAAVVLCEH